MATLKFATKLGRGNLQIEADSVKQFMLLCGLFTKAENECGKCKSDDLMPHGEVSAKQGYEFFSIKCRSCGAELRFGQRRDSSGSLFLKDWEGWQDAYSGGEGGGGGGGGQQRPQPQQDRSNSSRPPDRRSSGMAPASSGEAPPWPADSDDDSIPF